MVFILELVLDLLSQMSKLHFKRHPHFDWAFCLDDPTPLEMYHIQTKAEHDWLIVCKLNSHNQLVGVASHRLVPCYYRDIRRFMKRARIQPLVGHLKSAVEYISRLE